jgi:hypothetical protein
VAKQAIIFQKLYTGRLEFRTEAGATLQYSVQWWYPYGIEYLNTINRVELLDKGLHVRLCFGTKNYHLLNLKKNILN